MQNLKSSAIQNLKSKIQILKSQIISKRERVLVVGFIEFREAMKINRGLFLEKNSKFPDPPPSLNLGKVWLFQRPPLFILLSMLRLASNMFCDVFNFNWATAQTKIQPVVCHSQTVWPRLDYFHVTTKIEHNLAQNGRWHHPKWKMTSLKMEDDLKQNGRWHKPKMEDDLIKNERWPHQEWKMTSSKMEYDLTKNGRRPYPKWKMASPKM